MTLSCPRCAQSLSRKFVSDTIGEDQENDYVCSNCECEIHFKGPTYCQATLPLPLVEDQGQMQS